MTVVLTCTINYILLAQADFSCQFMLISEFPRSLYKCPCSWCEKHSLVFIQAKILNWQSGFVKPSSHHQLINRFCITSTSTFTFVTERGNNFSAWQSPFSQVSRGLLCFHQSIYCITKFRSPNNVQKCAHNAKCAFLNYNSFFESYNCWRSSYVQSAWSHPSSVMCTSEFELYMSLPIYLSVHKRIIPYPNDLVGQSIKPYSLKKIAKKTPDNNQNDFIILDRSQGLLQ